MHNPIPIKHTTSFQQTLFTFHPTQRILILALCCMSLRTMFTMRHVSWTHRVALDWLFDRIDLNPKIQIRHVDTKHQLADKMTKGNFTGDEWNNLFHLLNISHLCSACRTKNCSLISCYTMVRRIQNQKRRRRRRRRKSCVQVATSSNEYVFLLYCDKFLRRIESDCI